MPKINTIATVPVPKLSDKLVGTSVGGTPVNQTNNFTLQQLKTLFDGTPVSPNLQAVLNAGNTATQNIYLTGTIAATNATIANDASSKNLYLSERLFDRNNFQGTSGQYLTSTGTGVQWSTLTIATPTLQQVLTAGNISDKDITTTGNIQGANIQGTNITANSNLRVVGTLADSTNSVGTSGQVLSSTVTGVDWVDLPSYSAVSPLIYNNISRQFSIQQATGTQNGYLSSADWITFNGKQNAGNYITELTGEASALGPGAVNITLNNLAVINKTLTGLAISSGVITAADNIVTAFGKIQGQINGIVAGVVYKGAWNAATNTPTLTSSVGVQGNYYVVDVAGNTNLNGITDWQVGDWAIFNGTVWQKVDNTDAVTSVNGQTGIVVLNTDDISEGTTNLYYLDSRARAAISSVATGLTYTSSTGVFSLTSGYSIPTIANQTNWTTAYNDSIVSASVTGTTTKTLTLNQQDGGTITASWTDIDTNLVTSVFGRTGAVVAQAGDYSTSLVTEGTNLYYLDSRARAAISSSATGLTYTTATGVFSFTSGYSIPTDASQSNWTTAYNDSIVSAAVTGTTTKTLTLNQQDGGTITASWTDLDTGLTSVGLTMPTAFTVSNSPLTSNGTIAVTAAGNASQYVRGDGTLGDFPTGGGGGGASVSYYLNGSINQGAFGGNTYYQMSKTPIFGTGTDFSINANGYIAQFITDVGVPDSLLIPGGNWNFETYFSASSGGGTPTFYIELYKYDGVTFTLIASNSGSPESISLGTNINPYFNPIAVPETVLTVTDRLAIRIYVNHSGRTITLHTENGHLCQVITTFTTGLTALNGLTKQIQYFAVGTSGTDFNISSSVATHTFNLPTASAVNRGALSSTDWSTFNAKQNALTLTTTGTSGAATLIGATLNIPQYQAAGTYVNSVTASSPLASSGGVNPNITIQQATATQNGFLSSTDWSTFNNKQNTITLTTTGTSGAATLVGSTLNIPQYQSVLTNPITGTGTTNYLPKFTGSTTIGNSQIFDNGTNVGIGTVSPTRTVDILGASGIGTVLKLQGASGTTTYLQLAYNGATNAQSGYIGYNSSSQMQFFTNDTLALTIDSNRNLGLGVTPSAWSVYRAFQLGTGIAVGGLMGRTDGINEINFGLNWTYTGGASLTYIASSFATNYYQKEGSHIWQTAPSGTAGNTISFTQAMTLTSGGNLLVGTTSDNGSRLQVSGSATFSSSVTADSLLVQRTASRNMLGISSIALPTSGAEEGVAVVKTNSNLWQMSLVGYAVDSKGMRVYNTGGAGYTSFEVAQGAGTRFIVDGVGNVGIGTSSPATLLQVEGSAPIFTMNRTSGGFINRINFSSGGTNYASIISDAGAGEQRYSMGPSAGWGGYHTFYTDTTERMRITSNGNVGIGTASPTVAAGLGLVLNGQAGQTRLAFKNNYTGDTSGDGVQFALIGGSSAFVFQNRESDGYFSFETNGNEVFRTSGTNLLIGTTTDNGARLQVSGTARISGSGSTNLVVERTGSNGAFMQLLDGSGNSVFLGANNGDFQLQTPSGGFSNKLVVTNGGNLGLGVTPSAWDAGNDVKAFQFGPRAALWNFSTNNVFLGLNYYWNGTNRIYIGSSAATEYQQITGEHRWLTAPSGTAGNAISFTQAMTLDASGRLGIGTASPTNGLLVINSTAANGVRFALESSGTMNGIVALGSNAISGLATTDLALWTRGVMAFETGASGEKMRITSGGNVLMGTTTDNGNRLRVNGVGFFDSGIRTGQPVGTTTNNWLLGRALISGTSTPNRWIRVQIGLEYYDILAVYMGTL